MVRYINQVRGAPEAIGPYSQATEANGMVFISGQIPLDPKSGQMVEGGIERQTEQVLMNLSSILESQGLGFGNVVRSTIYLTDLANFQVVNEIYGRALGESRPARATVQVSALPKGCNVEIDMIAVK
ncbi:MAG: RidA family protein [Bdellovibrionales bacterium]|nr:RidA family protein [Bdellovibrionales bacterium]